MHNVKACILNETEKIFSRKKAVFFLSFTALIPILSYYIILRLQSGFGVAALGTANYPVLMLNVFTSLLLPLMIFMHASDMFSGEIADKTIRIAVTRPITRLKVFASKQVALAITLLIYLVVAFLSSVLCSFFLVERGNWLSGLLQSVIAYSAACLPMFTLGIVAVFLAQFFKNSSGALATCILLYALMKLAAFVFPQITVYTPTAYTDSYLLWIGNSVAFGKIASIYMFLIACCILFFTVGYIFFDKKEL